MPMGTGLIVGQALEADSTRPVPGVFVTLTLPGASPLRAMADGQGRFAFRDLPKGRYGVTVSKAGYVDGAHGRVRPGGPTLPIDLDDGHRVGGITIPIWKYAAVAGVVMDEQNEPVIGAEVRVLKRTIVGGHWRLTPGPTDLTDDRGAYRIGALEPGEYVVAVPMSQSSGPTIGSFFNLDGARDVVAVSGVAQARFAAVADGGGGAMRIETMLGGGGAAPPPDEAGRPQAYPTQFYPAAALSTRAESVTLGSGEERTGLDFQLEPVRTMRVTGSILGPDGPAGNMPLTLVPAETGDLSSPIETLSAFSDASGTFTFAAVPAGQYTLHASRAARGGMPVEAITQIAGGAVAVRAISVTRGGGPAPLPSEPTLWAETSVAVGTSDIDDLVVSLRNGLKVTGTLQFDGAAPRPPADQLTGISVWLEPATPTPGGSTSIRGRVDQSGTFETMGVAPGRYFVRVSGAPQNWHFRGAMAGARDVSDLPLAIESEDATGVMLTFTDRPADLSGQVTNAGAGADNAATVIIFPADSSAWVGYGSTTRRLRSVRADKDGRYTAQNLPPGDYLVAAVPDKQAGDWMNPKFLESLAPLAARVRIGAGEKVTQNVQVGR